METDRIFLGQRSWMFGRRESILKDTCSRVDILHDQLGARVNEIDQDKDRDIVLYCVSGHRSGLAKKTLESLGYTNVLNAGGYEPMLKAK